MRAWRISAALATAALLIPLALVDSAAEADSTAAKPPERQAQAQQTPAPFRVVLDSPLRVTSSIRHLATTKATAPPPHKATPPPKRERPTTRPTTRPKPRPTAAERVSRSSTRPALAKAAPTLAGARSYARSQLSADQYACLSRVVERESGWNPSARNASSGAYGLFQALPGSKMSSAGSDWATNPSTQMRWGISYMRARYGSPCGAWYFWQKNGWY